MEEGRSPFKILTGKLTENILLGRPMRGWKDNIRMDLKEIEELGCECCIEPPGSIRHEVSYLNVCRMKIISLAVILFSSLSLRVHRLHHNVFRYAA